MKKFLYPCALILSLFSVLPAFGWTLYVTNWVDKAVNIHTSWAGSGWFLGKCFSCCDDHVTLQPGQRIAINAGECLLTELRVDGGTSYTSSGQRNYHEFHIIGPVHNELLTGRISDVYPVIRVDATKVGQVINATPFTATDVRVEVKQYNSRATTLLDPQIILPGEAFNFDVPGGYYIGRIEATINGKVIVNEPKVLNLSEGGRYSPLQTSVKYFISGPPDGSNPQFIKFVQ